MNQIILREGRHRLLLCSKMKQYMKFDSIMLFTLVFILYVWLPKCVSGGGLKKVTEGAFIVESMEQHFELKRQVTPESPSSKHRNRDVKLIS